MPATTQSAIRLEKPLRFEARKVAVPEPREGETLLRIRRIGVCGTDIHAFHGRQPFFEYPRILGHELGAEVVVSHGSAAVMPGDRVTVEPYLNDPGSPASRKGKTNCCESLEVLGVHTDGGMRPFLTVPSHKLHRSFRATPDQLALVEMLCIGQHAVNRSLAVATDHALILGAGPIGLSVLSFLRNRTANIAVADLSENRLGFCRDSFGVEATLPVVPGRSLEKALRDTFGGELPGLIFDATGNRNSMASTFELAAHGARLVFVGLFQGELSFDDPNFHRRELTVMASRNATAPEFEEVISAVETGAIDTSAWITHRISLGEVPSRFSGILSEPGLHKAIIDCD